MIACAAIAAALATATPGTTIAASGTCEAALRLPARDYGGVTLDASEATLLEGAVIDRAKGLHIRGGRWGRTDRDTRLFHTITVTRAEDFSFCGATVVGNGNTVGSGISVAESQGVTICDNLFDGHSAAGASVRSSSDAVVTRNRITNSTADGINITDSQRVVVSFNRCTDFKPGPLAHPDCIQLRNLKDRPPQSDVLVLGNVAIGQMQAFFGDCNRTTFINNYAAVSKYLHTITCAPGGVGNVAIGNMLSNLPSSPAAPGRMKGFLPEWTARNTVWDARVQGMPPMPPGVQP